MRKLLVGLLIAGSLCLTFTPRTAVAGSGEVAAGIVGGLAVGTLFGGRRSRAALATINRCPSTLQPAPVYVGPPCYWTRGAPVWDGYRGIWYRPRIQVCELNCRAQVKRRRVPARLVFRFSVAEQLCADHDKHDHTVPAVSRCPADDRVVVQSVWIRNATSSSRTARAALLTHS